jgi:hypothetical protein
MPARIVASIAHATLPGHRWIIPGDSTSYPAQPFRRAGGVGAGKMIVLRGFLLGIMSLGVGEDVR